MEYLHKNNITNINLKTNNIVIDAKGIIKL